MRFRLLHRRLTISAPRMAIRSALPWPFRWALVAIVMGFCAAIGLWAFELGRDIAGLEKVSKEELQRLHTQVATLQNELARVEKERDQAQSIANTADTLVTAERASRQTLLDQVRQLEQDNRALRDDLGFFEKLIPTQGKTGVSIRGLQADMLGSSQVKWQVLIIQAAKNAAPFQGRLELTLSGLQGGKSWSTAPPQGALSIKIGQYGRFEGVVEVPPEVVVKSVSVRLMEGSVQRASQTIKL
jgi:hypothetical protein